MPRSKTGVRRGPVDPAAIQKAILAVTAPSDKRISMRKACRMYNVKLSTLSRALSVYRSSGQPERFAYTPNFEVNRVFSDAEEGILVGCIQKAAKINYWLSKKGVRLLAYKFAVANKKKIPENWSREEIAGEQWMRFFMKRHRNISTNLCRSALHQAGAWEEVAGPCNTDDDSTPVPEIPFVHVKEEPIWDDEDEDSNLQPDLENQLDIDESKVEHKPTADLTLTIPKTETVLQVPTEKPTLGRTPHAKSRTEDSKLMGDEFLLTGQNVTKKLSRMDRVQALYAESLIFSVLMKGLLGKLTEQTDICENSCNRKPVPPRQSEHISTTAGRPASTKKEEPVHL